MLKDTSVSMNRQEAKKLFEKYNSGTASQEEQIQLEQWYHREQAGQKLSEEEANFIFLKDEIWQGTLNRSGLSNIRPFKKYIKLWPQITAAALILIALSFGLYFYSGTDRPTQYSILNTQYQTEDIAPGGNKAILTLADGRKISLTDATNGALAEQSGIRITKTADGQLIYTVSALSPSGGDAEGRGGFNTIETPRGGQYQVILPDGTKVWLNAASSLKYPASFASLKERRVELNGEAYFEVAKAVGLSPSGGGGGRIPFIVNTDKQEIEVLGTHFNVNSYADEGSTKTTLLEGSVKVSAPFSPSPLERAGVRLQPGQQSILAHNTIRVSNADTEEVMAWKNGYFRFDDEKLESIMRKIARWYDVDVTWQDETLKNELFGAVTTRFANVSRLLKMMEQTGDVKFNIEDEKIIISKKR